MSDRPERPEQAFSPVRRLHRVGTFRIFVGNGMRLARSVPRKCRPPDGRRAPRTTDFGTHVRPNLRKRSTRHGKNTLPKRRCRRDIPRILEIIRQARHRMAAAGSQQWQDGYPALDDIAADVVHACGYVLCHAGEAAGHTFAESGSGENRPENGNRKEEPIVAYGAILFDGEPAYAEIRGAWLTAGPYVVVHRLAVADEALGHGLGTEFLRHAARLALERGIRAFRIDTNFDNHRMLRILARNGFTRCGTIRYRSGQREAFEKILLREATD